ncbi:hypothetical protein [Pontibacter sp. 172403-2]|nr:hypothetical protein [Pontibacter sp. 172403-2]
MISEQNYYFLLNQLMPVVHTWQARRNKLIFNLYFDNLRYSII